jgi:hypothetical protein
MKKALALAVFTGVFASVYLASFVNGWTLFRYYPLTGQITTEDLPRTAGPAMGWYAWIVQGLIAAALAALVVYALPRRATQRAWPGLGGLLALLVVIYIFYIEWHWFGS